MKTFNNFRKLSLFIVWVLVALLAGVGTSIYADEDSNRDAKKDVIEIKLEPGEEGKEYCTELHDPESRVIKTWQIQESETKNLPDGLQIRDNGILCGTPTKVGKFTFKMTGADSNNNEFTYIISLNIKPKINFSQSEKLRIITGYEISRASSTTGSEKAFFDVYFSQPLPFFFNKKRRLNVWGNIRFTSIPLQNDKAIGAISGDYFSTLSGLKLNEMTQSAEFLVGIERNLWSIKKSKEREYNYTLALTVAYGGSTPMVSETNPQLVVFNMPTSDQLRQELKNRYSCTDADFVGKEYISFVPEDRESFFHQYYFGFRLKAYTNENGNSKLPVTIDISYGMNQAASGGIGKLFGKKSVVRFDGFLPIEILHIPIYLFGTVCINVAKDDIVHTPLILGELVTDDNTQSINSDKLLIVTEKPNKRDFFKIGIGIDLYKIFKTSQDNKNEEVKKANLKAREAEKARNNAEKKVEENAVNKEDIKEIKNRLGVMQVQMEAAEQARKLAEEKAKQQSNK